MTIADVIKTFFAAAANYRVVGWLKVNRMRPSRFGTIGRRFGRRRWLDVSPRRNGIGDMVVSIVVSSCHCEKQVRKCKIILMLLAGTTFLWMEIRKLQDGLGVGLGKEKNTEF